MSLQAPRPLANGLRTDHPVPDLPFVDDSHIPLDDPEGIEAVGRGRGDDMWGREDPCYDAGGWVAFTTDPARHDLAWCMRWHPAHGRSVLLYRDEDAPQVHDDWQGPALLFRSGGYWWDGATWYRPRQVWDVAAEDYFRRPVAAAITVTAADLLDGNGDPAHGRVLKVADIDPDAPPVGNWPDDLALWAQRGEHRPPAECVVKFAAAELSGDQLVGVAEMARIGDVGASTLRAYISRGEGDVPEPQAVVGGRSVWARPVAAEWAEQRRRSPDGVAEVVRQGADAHPGVARVRDHFARQFFTALWESPARRKRWALRWRNQESVREVAAGLGWIVADDISAIVPMRPLAVTIRHALLDQFAIQQERGGGGPAWYGLGGPLTQMMDWLIRCDPGTAGQVIGETIGSASRRLGIPREVIEKSLRVALGKDGTERAARREFLNRVLSPNDRAV